MKKWTLVVVMGVVVMGGVSAVPQLAMSQVEKTVQGQYGPTPYISHAEFQSSSVGGGSISRKSTGSQPMLRDILAVLSLEEVTRRFGEPASTEYKRAPEGMSLEYIVYLTYDGLDLKYRKRGEKIRLETMAITSEDWFLRVGGMKLQPGMSTDSLSAVMRKAIRDDGEGFFRVAPPGKSEDPRSIRSSETTIQLWTETDAGSDIVKKVRFHRIAP